MPSTPEEKGCYGVAQEEVYGPQFGMSDNSEFQDLFDAQSLLYEQVEKDPALVDTIKAWTSCLEGKGYPGFQKMPEPRNDVETKAAALRGYTITVGADGSTMYSSADGGNGAEVVPDPGKMAELKKYEIELALADYDCQGDYRNKSDEVRIALEKQFIIDHQAELDKFRDAQNAGR
ncbi:hypothetical protein EH165_13855 [Nakamurella antarctica]|uniref:Uncharacterized protein n=2 Tax=Nakamurella antarctica TaxID=1902245 RepID=A0A3G8ZP74_9ACTN|nr:hypothetical protein EH165_13855 [Nakamurella antarctica]